MNKMKETMLKRKIMGEIKNIVQRILRIPKSSHFFFSLPKGNTDMEDYNHRIFFITTKFGAQTTI